MHDMMSAYNIHYLCCNPLAIEEIVSYLHEKDYVICGSVRNRRYWMMMQNADPNLKMMNNDYIYSLNQSVTRTNEVTSYTFCHHHLSMKNP